MAQQHQHIVPQKIYLLIFVTLLMLTLITVDVAFYNFGILNFTLAMAIAATKATLVVLYFMHLRYSSRLTWVFFATAILWLGVLMVFTFSDILTRDWDPTPSGWTTGVTP